MGSALILNNSELKESLELVDKASSDEAYLNKFKVVLPEGINTASVLEICRIVEKADLEAKVRLMRICIKGKPVEVTCPNGETERFCMSNVDDALDALPLFSKEPLALMAISNAVYGHILKNSIRLSETKPIA